MQNLKIIALLTLLSSIVSSATLSKDYASELA